MDVRIDGSEGGRGCLYPSGSLWYPYVHPPPARYTAVRCSLPLHGERLLRGVYREWPPRRGRLIPNYCAELALWITDTEQRMDGRCVYTVWDDPGVHPVTQPRVMFRGCQLRYGRRRGQTGSQSGLTWSMLVVYRSTRVNQVPLVGHPAVFGWSSVRPSCVVRGRSVRSQSVRCRWIRAPGTLYHGQFMTD